MRAPDRDPDDDGEPDVPHDILLALILIFASLAIATCLIREYGAVQVIP
jgi:hypothetical protein